ncbi:MAG: FtsX-like permease family protein [Candidatus Jordarchaeales archaeon]
MALLVPVAGEEDAKWRTRMMEETIPSITSSINFTNIARWRGEIANYSRFVGTDGYYKATRLIYSKLREFVPESHLENFTVVVPINRGANITIRGRTLKLYPMFPNWVSPCTTLGETGKLVYVGRGNLDSLDGKEINGSIVVMDFNSGYNWLTVAALGAKAIIFLEPKDTTNSESRMKYVDSPVKILRFYVCDEDAKILLESCDKGLEGRIVSSQVWEEREAYNIVGFIEGKSRKDEIIAFFTYYDSFSPVPDLAYDKDAAGNPAAWLEIARYFSHNRPERSILLVAFSGHYQHLRGMAAYLENVFKDLEQAKQFADKIRIALAIDLSTESPAAILTFGLTWQQGPPPELFPVNNVPLFEAGVYREIDKLLFRNGREIRNEGWALKTGNVRLGDESLLVMMCNLMNNSRDPPYLIGNGLDREYNLYKTVLMPLVTSRLETAMFMTATGRISLTLLSALTKREKWNTPLATDTFILENLKPNIEFMTCVLHVFANEVGINIYVGNEDAVFKVSATYDMIFRTGFEERFGMGFPIVRGQVLTWDEAIGNYRPVENAIVVLSTFYGEPIITKADRNGFFEIAGIRGVGGQTQYFETVVRYFTSAFVLDETTGDIICAPDSGQYGYGGGPLFVDMFQVERVDKMVNIVVFECGSLVLFDPVDPVRLKLTDEVSFVVNHAVTHVSVIHFGLPDRYLQRAVTLSREAKSPETIIPPCYPLPVFVPVGTSVEVVAYARAKPVGVINNGGRGYELSRGVSKYIYTPAAFASDLFKVSSERLGKLAGRYVFSGGMKLENENEVIREYVSMMEEGFRKLSYSDYILYAYKTLYRGLNNYESSKGIYFDTAGTAIILLLLLLPFSFMLERLIFQANGLKRMLILITATAIFTYTVYLLHPGFEIVSSFYIMLLGLLAMLLFIPAFLMLQSQLSHELRKERERRMGIHETPIDKLSAAILSLSYGVNSMRKRPFRTLLVLISVVIFIFSLVLLTTAYSYVMEYMREKTVSPEMRPKFNGIMFEALLLEVPSMQPQQWFLSESAIRFINLSLQKEFGRVKIYPRVENAFEFVNTIEANTYARTCAYVFVNGEVRFNLSFPLKSIYGLSAAEPSLGLWNTSRYVTEGRWFSSDDALECIISKDLKEAYGIKMGDHVSFTSGTCFKVVGVLDGELLKSDDPREINGQSIAPTHMNVEDWRMAWAQVQSGMGLPKTYGSFIILPWKTLLDTYGGTIRRIVVPLDRFDEKVKNYAQYTSLESCTDITVSDKDESKIYAFSKGLLASSSGFNFVIIPLVMVLLILSSTVYSNLYERKKDVYITSVTGASPVTVIFMFLGESLVYSILGSFLGYVLALLVLRIAIVLMGQAIFASGIAMNYGSSYVGTAVVLSFLATILSSIIPLVRIVAIAAPSLKRKWEVARPKGDTWEIKMPVDIMEEEVYGVISYIWEFMNVHSGDVLSLFNIADKRFLMIEEMGVRKVKSVYLLNMLPPERGVSQELQIIYVWNQRRGMYSTTLILTRKQGEARYWIERSMRLIDHLRKQHLLWGSLQDEVKKNYMQKGREMFKGQQVS